MPKLRPEVLLQFGHHLEALSQDLGRHHASVEATLSAQGRKLDALDSKLASLGPSAAGGDWPQSSSMPAPVSSASAPRWDPFAMAPPDIVGCQHRAPEDRAAAAPPCAPEDRLATAPPRSVGHQGQACAPEDLLSNGPGRTAAKLLLELQPGRADTCREGLAIQSREMRTDLNGDAVLSNESALQVNGNAMAPRSMGSTDVLRPSSVDSMIKTLESNLQQRQKNLQQLDAQNPHQPLQPLSEREEHRRSLQRLQQELLVRLLPGSNNQQQQQEQQEQLPVGPGNAGRRSSSLGACPPPIRVLSPNGNTELTGAAEVVGPAACRHPWYLGL